MNYSDFERMTRGKNLPMAGRNEEGENVIISRGDAGEYGGKFFKVVVPQRNGWVRTKIYYENGAAEESYMK